MQSADLDVFALNVLYPSLDEKSDAVMLGRSYGGQTDKLLVKFKRTPWALLPRTRYNFIYHCLSNNFLGFV